MLAKCSLNYFVISEKKSLIHKFASLHGCHRVVFFLTFNKISICDQKAVLIAGRHDLNGY